MARDTPDRTPTFTETASSKQKVWGDDPSNLRYNRQMLIKHIKKLQDATGDYKAIPADADDELWMIHRAKGLEHKARKKGIEFQELPPPTGGAMPGRYPDKNYRKFKGRKWGMT